MPRLLVATAVTAERDAIAAGLPASDQAGTAPAGPGPRPDEVRVAVVGVGPAAAAAGTTRLLTLAEAAGAPYAAVVSAGIAGGFTGRVPVTGLVVATRSVAADLGAGSPDGFLPLDELGFGTTTIAADRRLAAALRAALPAAVAGAVLTVHTVTGTAERAGTLAGRFPDAVAEAMEGYGVGCAAALCGVRFAELRTVSNPVGPRDRGGWRIAAALAGLTAAAPALAGAAREVPAPT